MGYANIDDGSRKLPHFSSQATDTMVCGYINRSYMDSFQQPRTIDNSTYRWICLAKKGLSVRASSPLLL